MFEASSSPLWLGLFVMRWTGVRASEMLQLPFDCVRDDSRENRFIKVPLGKLNSERLVQLDDKTYNVIERLRALRTAGSPWLVTSRQKRGEPYSYKSLCRALRNAAVLCRFQDPDPITSHRLRHTYSTRMLEAGMSLSALRKILGHRDVNMTLRYAAMDSCSLAEQHAAAFEKIQTKYAGVIARTVPSEHAIASVAADELIRTIKRNAREHPHHTQDRARQLVKRLERLANELNDPGL